MGNRERAISQTGRVPLEVALRKVVLALVFYAVIFNAIGAALHGKWRTG